MVRGFVQAPATTMPPTDLGSPGQVGQAGAASQAPGGGASITQGNAVRPGTERYIPSRATIAARYRAAQDEGLKEFAQSVPGPGLVMIIGRYVLGEISAARAAWSAALNVGFLALGAWMGGGVEAGASTALAKYDADFAAQQILKSTTNVTQGGRTISVHAAERMMTPPVGRGPTTMAEVDHFLDTATQVRKISPHPLGDTLTLRNANAPRVKEVVVDAATGQRVITVITPK